MKKIGKRLQVYISVAVVLSGCAGQEQEAEEPETVAESVQAEEAEGPLAENNNPNIPKNTASETSSYVTVEIHNEEE